MTSKNLQKIKKEVKFADQPTIYMMYAWTYAYQTARCGKWMEMARDRERFKIRIMQISNIVTPVLIKKYEEFINNKTINEN